MERHEFLNHVISLRFGKRSISYLELGSGAKNTFKKVRANRKVGVDPNHPADYRMKSREFLVSMYANSHPEPFDLIFVDGLHQRLEAAKDVLDSINVLRDGGVIVVDDCLPEEEHQQVFLDSPPGGPWCGDVWKAITDLRAGPMLDICTVNEGWGFGVVLNRLNTAQIDVIPDDDLTWENYLAYRRSWLRVIPLNLLPDFLEGKDVAQEGNYDGDRQ